VLARLGYGEVWVIGYQADITTEEQIITDAVIKVRGQTAN
jgi:hypothetical protein